MANGTAVNKGMSVAMRCCKTRNRSSITRNKNSVSAEVANRTRADGVIFPIPHHFQWGDSDLRLTHGHCGPGQGVRQKSSRSLKPFGVPRLYPGS